MSFMVAFKIILNQHVLIKGICNLINKVTKQQIFD